MDCFVVGHASAHTPAAPSLLAVAAGPVAPGRLSGAAGSLGQQSGARNVAMAFGALVAGLRLNERRASAGAAHGGRLRAQKQEVYPAADATIRSPTPLFDPIGISKDPVFMESSMKMEMAFGRFAMLAAIGIPASEIYHEDIASVAGLPSRLPSTGQAPTWLTGGEFSPIAEVAAVMGLVGLAALAIETSARHQRGDSDYDLINNEQMKQTTLSPLLKSMLKEAQLFNGRAAMLGVTFILIQEAITGEPTFGAQ